MEEGRNEEKVYMSGNRKMTKEEYEEELACDKLLAEAVHAICSDDPCLREVWTLEKISSLDRRMFPEEKKYIFLNKEMTKEEYDDEIAIEKKINGYLYEISMEDPPLKEVWTMDKIRRKFGEPLLRNCSNRGGESASS